MQVDQNHRRYWQKNVRVIALLLFVWFAATFGVAFFARALNFGFFGWPFSVWMAGQGALVVYCLIVAYYARYMNRLDHEHGVAEDD